MKERPILFSGPMIKALLAGTKTQTRRIVKWKVRPESSSLNFNAASLSCGFYCTGVPSSGFVLRSRGAGSCWNDRTFPIHCPHGILGDRLWVKEAWRVGKPHDQRTALEIWDHLKESGQGVTVLYDAGGWRSRAPFERLEQKYTDDERMPSWAGRKRSSMFMPRWASRINLEITDVRVERVQDISGEDARAEGEYVFNGEELIYAETQEQKNTVYKRNYRFLWDSINGKKHPWSQNDWVWVISFERVENHG
jgi:hypothetical protein